MVSENTRLGCSHHNFKWAEATALHLGFIFILNCKIIDVTKTYLLWQCNSKSIINVCHAFSLLSASSAVGIKAKHRVITSSASQQTCSSSMSGSFPAFVCENKQECIKWVQKTIPRNPTGSKVYHWTQTQTTALYTKWWSLPSILCTQIWAKALCGMAWASRIVLLTGGFQAWTYGDRS